MPTANIIGAITLLVDDVERSRAWYQHVFDRPVVHEDANSAVIEFGNTVINLLHRPEADGLIAPALVAPGNAGAVLQLTTPHEREGGQRTRPPAGGPAGPDSTEDRGVARVRTRRCIEPSPRLPPTPSDSRPIASDRVRSRPIASVESTTAWARKG